MEASVSAERQNNASLPPPSSESRQTLLQFRGVVPLYWPGGMRPRLKDVHVDAMWRYLPVLSYFCRRSNWNKLIQPIFDQIDAQLNLRPSMWNFWQIDGAQLAFVQRLSEIIACEMGWPNSHFIPSDPSEIVLSSRISDGFEIVQTCALLKRKSGINFLTLLGADICQCKTYGELAGYFWEELKKSGSNEINTGNTVNAIPLE